MGKNAGRSQMRGANRLYEDIVKKAEALGIPSVEAQRIALESPELVGLLESEQLGSSAFEDVELDPRLQAAQLSALEDITGISETGLGAEDRLALEEVKRQAAGQAQAQKASILQEMEARGMGDSGASLAAQLSAGQQAANTQAMQGMRQAAQAQQARMSALGQQANLASGIQQQRLGLAGQKAGAKDAISQFNLQQRAGTQQANLAAQQNIANMATATRNQQEMYNKQLQQQQFQNELQRLGLTTGAMGQQAESLMQQGAAAQQAQQAMTGAIIEAGATVGAAAMGRPPTSDINAKKNIDSYSSEDFLDKLNPYTYEYKDKSDGEGKQAGVMAQDLEKTEVGKKSVIDTPEGKKVDYNKLGPEMLASLVELHQRLKKLEGK